jgi:hypothetical protein
MKTIEITNKIIASEKLRIVICDEWIVERNGNKLSVQHTYYYKGENFEDLKSGLKYLKTKLNYLVKRGYQLTIQ